MISYWVAGFSLDDSLDQLLQKKDKNSSRVIETLESSGILTGSTGQWFQDLSHGRKDLLEKKKKDIRNYFQANDQEIYKGMLILNDYHSW